MQPLSKLLIREHKAALDGITTPPVEHVVGSDALPGRPADLREERTPSWCLYSPRQ